MSTNAFITLHDLSVLNGKTNLTTATFYRHWDGDMDQTMANFFYEAFVNPLKAKGGYFDAFMCADPSEVEFFDMVQYDVTDCCSEYHYHLDCRTLELVVLHEDVYHDVAKHECFRGTVSEFINQYSGENKTVITRSEYNQVTDEVFTREGMIEQITKCFTDIERLNNPLNPNFKNWVKMIDRRLILLDDMSLSTEARQWRGAALDLAVGYEQKHLIALEQQRIEQEKQEANTTHLNNGLSITILD